MELRAKVKEHWEYSAKGYSQIIKDELNSFRPKAWMEIINKFINKESKIDVLDVGCGPGFFSIILSKEGHKVVGVDCTHQMIEEAKLNYKEEMKSIEDKCIEELVNPMFMVMDSHKLDFDDNSFDLIISRNVTWTLADPVDAYKEWNRVLRPGGTLLIFDANWHLYKFDEELRKENERREALCIEKYGSTYEAYDGPEEKILSDIMPLEDKIRPTWDEEVLTYLGYENIYTEKNIINKVWDEKEQLLFGASPMFMIACEKSSEDMEIKDDVNFIKNYWTKRAPSYSEQNKAELDSYKHKIWRNMIVANSPKKEVLKVLDIGCGPGEFSIIMAQGGHEVTGVDITQEMLNQASENAKKYNVELELKCMDVHDLQFEDNTFDIVISRNVTWHLQNPEKFFKECKRVLKDDGRVIYFDANWYLYLHDKEDKEKKKISEKKYENKYGVKLTRSIDEIGLAELAYNLPMSKVRRPQWDVENLPKFGFNILNLDSNINHVVLDEMDQDKCEVTPMFMVVAEKN